MIYKRNIQNYKITFDFTVTIVKACMRQMQNACQKIPYEILEKLVKCWL